MVIVLGIEVDADLLARWRCWFAPAVQPFRAATAAVAGSTPLEISPEVRDTYFVYDGEWCCLSEDAFNRLPAGERRAMLRGRDRGAPRLWPGDLAAGGDDPLLRWVEAGVGRSRHAEVGAATWRQARELLPGARDLAGTFPDRSGANCFGTVMAAAGVDDAAAAWMHQAPFEAWLAAATRPLRGTSYDDRPGVVLLWRDGRGTAVHAAVTIGDGYALAKPSQAWCSPRLVRTVRETIQASRFTGVRLERHRIASYAG